MKPREPSHREGNTYGTNPGFDIVVERGREVVSTVSLFDNEVRLFFNIRQIGDQDDQDPPT